MTGASDGLDLAYLASLTRLRAAAGVLLFDEQGRVMVVYPSYKESCELPGGSLEPGESPLLTCELWMRSRKWLMSLAWVANAISGGCKPVAKPGWVSVMTLIGCSAPGREAMDERKIHPMAVKTMLAADITSTIHGIEAAAAIRAGFKAQFSQKRFSDTPDLPLIDRADHADTTVGELFVKVTQAVPSMNQVRRVASGGGLRLVAETPGTDQQTVSLTEADVNGSLAALLTDHESLVAQAGTRIFLKCGRFLIEVQ